MSSERKPRVLGEVADELRQCITSVRIAIMSASGIDRYGDDAVLELAHAVVLLRRAAARFDDSCGLPDPVDVIRIHGRRVTPDGRVE